LDLSFNDKRNESLAECVGGVKDSRASETTPADESSSVLRVSGLPLTADKQTVVALFPGTSTKLLLLLFLVYL